MRVLVRDMAALLRSAATPPLMPETTLLLWLLVLLLLVVVLLLLLVVLLDGGAAAAAHKHRRGPLGLACIERAGLLPALLLLVLVLLPVRRLWRGPSSYSCRRAGVGCVD